MLLGTLLLMVSLSITKVSVSVGRARAALDRAGCGHDEVGELPWISRVKPGGAVTKTWEEIVAIHEWIPINRPRLKSAEVWVGNLQDFFMGQVIRHAHAAVGVVEHPARGSHY